MEDFNILKQKLEEKILDQINLDELYRDPLGYSFIYWEICKNDIDLEVKKDLKREIERWKKKFIENPSINNFLDRNITTLFFLYDKLPRNINTSSEEIRKVLQYLKAHFNAATTTFFGNLFYTLIILRAIKKLNSEELKKFKFIDEIGQIQNKVIEIMKKPIIFNDPKIFPFLLEVLDENKRKEFIDAIKANILSGYNIVDQEKVFYAWVLLKFRSFLGVNIEELKLVEKFASCSISIIKSLIFSLSDEVLGKLYGKNIRESFPFYWLGYAYEVVNDYEKFSGTTTSDFAGRLEYLFNKYGGTDELKEFYSTAKEKIKLATFSEDLQKKKRYSTESVYYLALLLEGTLKFVYYHVIKDEKPKIEGSLDETISRTLGYLKACKFINQRDLLWKNIVSLKDKFRDLVMHFQVDIKDARQKRKFKSKQFNLEEAKLFLGQVQPVICALLENLGTFHSYGQTTGWR